MTENVKIQLSAWSTMRPGLVLVVYGLLCISSQAVANSTASLTPTSPSVPTPTSSPILPVLPSASSTTQATPPSPSPTHTSVLPSVSSTTQATPPSPPAVPTQNTETDSIELILSAFSLTYIIIGGLGILLICGGVMFMAGCKCKRRKKNQRISIRQPQMIPLEQPLVSETYNKMEQELTHHESFVNTKKETSEIVPSAKRDENEYVQSNALNNTHQLKTSSNMAYGLVSATDIQEEAIYDNETAEPAVTIDDENIYDNDEPTTTSPVKSNPHTDPNEEEEEYEVMDTWQGIPNPQLRGQGIPNPQLRGQGISNPQLRGQGISNPQLRDWEEENIYDNDVPERDDSENEYLDIVAVNPHPSNDDIEEDIYDN